MSQVPKPVTRRRESADFRRDQILDAAESVLLERGLGASTVADVADAAGIAKGTVYLHFAPKTELLVGLRARPVERFRCALAEALSGSTRARPASLLDRFIEAFFDYSITHRSLHHLLFHEAGFSENDAFADLKALLRQFISDGIDTGDFARSEVDAV